MDIKRIVRLQVYILMVGLALIGSRIGAQEQSGRNQSRSGQNWKVGICRFEGQELLPQYSRFTYQLPASLFQTIRRCPTHLCSPEELQGIRQNLKRDERSALEKELHGLLLKRASGFLNKKEADNQELTALDNEIDDKRAEIRHLLRTDLSEWKIEARPDCILADTNADGDLFSPPKLPLRVWTDEKGLDCLIQGKIEALEELLYIEVSAYLHATNSNRTVYRGTFFPSEVDQLKEELNRTLRSFLYGEQWSDVTFDIEPATAKVVIDGSEAEVDETGTVRYLDPGLHSIELRAEGYLTNSFTVETESGGRELIDVSLEKLNPQTWLIHSIPSEAAVFVNSVQVGTTPLLLKEQVAPTNLLLTKSGYAPRMYVLEEKHQTLEAHLHPVEVNIDAVIEHSRQRFYQGLAAFLLSLPLTVVSYGLSSEYAYAYNSALTNPSVGSSELERLQARSTLWYTAYAGSMLLNGILLTDTVLQMWQYIQSSQEY